LSLIAVEWLYYLTVRALRRTGFEVELIAICLRRLDSRHSFCRPGSLYKQFARYF
jgi:hypothetical protein